MDHGFTKEELKIIRRFNTPRKIQDFLATLPWNFENAGDTCFSPRLVLRNRRAHCVEGAFLAAAMLRVHGYKPRVMDLRSAAYDYDHVVAVFQIDGHYGAISKTNHGVLRYREPIYKTVRELALSYFHEYFLDDGAKTLRSYSGPIDLSRFDRRKWMTSEGHLWDIYKYVDKAKHYSILTRAQISRLRKADPIEREMGRVVEWRKPQTKKRKGRNSL